MANHVTVKRTIVEYGVGKEPWIPYEGYVTATESSATAAQVNYL
jgi:hypothetical protein